ncbi:MAG: aldo/keto reductase [Deltaproteobacteria bacterium]|nr:aldo/keto reductase [Deltaproteobacteria bacterium]
MKELITRKLGRTGRQVTTLGLGGQASIQWPAAGVDSAAIIEKAYRLGVNYLDTSNIYGPSQQHFGEAFRRLGLSPATANYDPAARGRIYVATKTHIRTARRPAGTHFRTDYSEGMLDDFHVSTAVDDVRRSLSLIFGDGKGGYPEGAYLDCLQFHNINTMDEIDILFTGLDDPRPESDWLGALPAMLDLREGTNRTGCNPKKEKLIRHIGITGHWNSAVHIYAIQRDSRHLLDTLLVTINASDGKYLAHRHNAIAAAAAAGMGVIGMKVFADAAYYHKEPRFSSHPDDVYHDVGSPELPSDGPIRYTLSVAGVSTIILGIGHIDDDPEKCQLTRNLAAAQLTEPLDDKAMAAIEGQVTAAGKDRANSFFQRKALGLTPPRNVGAEADSSMPKLGRTAVRVTWDTAYAGAVPIVRYEVLRDGEVVGSVPHTPQFTARRFHYDDIFPEGVAAGSRSYSVRAVDAAGAAAESATLAADPVTAA